MKEAQEKLEQAKRDDAARKTGRGHQGARTSQGRLGGDSSPVARRRNVADAGDARRPLPQNARSASRSLRRHASGSTKCRRSSATATTKSRAGRLSRKESQIAVEADKALAVLREEGSAVAFPEAVAEMRDDMEQVVARLEPGQSRRRDAGHRKRHHRRARRNDRVAEESAERHGRKGQARASRLPAVANRSRRWSIPWPS